MVGRVLRIVFHCLFIFGLGFLPPVFAAGSDPLKTCSHILALMRERKSAQPISVAVPGIGSVLVHNAEIARSLQNFNSPAIFESIIRRLVDEGAFNLSVNQHHVLVTAPNGIYAKKGWDRDHLRGTNAHRVLGKTDMAKTMTMASLKRYGNQWWRVVLTLQDIASNPDPSKRRYVREGHHSLPQVIFDPETLSDFIDTSGNPTPWSIQKDAYALYLHSALDNVDEELRAKLNQDQKLSLAGMFALLNKIEFWKVPTADAWEEENQIFTGGVGLVTSAFERLKDELQSPRPQSEVPRIIEDITAQTNTVDPYTKHIIKTALTEPELSKAIENGYRVIFEQLNAGGESPKIEDRGMGRTADLSLLWLFTYRLKRFTEADYAKVLSIVETLVDENGVVRYRDPYPDGYLHPGYFFGEDDLLPREMLLVDRLKVGDTTHAITGKFTRQLFFDRKTASLATIFGPKFSAQWPLGLAKLLQAYVKMVRWFPESPSRDKYKEKAREYAIRLLATASPGNGPLNRAMRVDGTEMPAFRFGEAIIPFRIYDAQSQLIETLYSYSPYSPLNWCAGEALSGLKGFWEMEFPDLAFPLK